MSYLIWAFAIALCSFWVVYDSSKHKMGATESKTVTPFKIGIGCLLFFPFCFPYYLFKRNGFIQRATLNPMDDKEASSGKVGFILALIAVIVITFNAYQEAQLPACESTEVASVVKSIYDQAGLSGITLKGAGQYDYDMLNEVRYCRAQWEKGGAEKIFNYTVSWMSDKKENYYVEVK
jgi:hypothetical protein